MAPAATSGATPLFLSPCTPPMSLTANREVLDDLLRRLEETRHWPGS
ncbi:MAG: hypothetical protein ACK5UG_12160 [Synechococcaceae cyanobacterium]